MSDTPTHAPDPIDAPTWSAIEALVSGDATPTVRRVVEHWVGGSPERRQLLDAITKARHLTHATTNPSFDTTTAWHSALSRIATPAIDQRPRARPRMWSRTIWGSLGLGAAIMVLALVSLLRRSGVHVSSPTTYASVLGERLSVTLHDGTTVTLAPGSRLQVASTFDNGARAVTLDGEAYFAVVHDRQHPFVVETGRATITDIGTEFDVRAYPEDGNTRVAVTHGSVVVGAGRGTAAVWRFSAPPLVGNPMSHSTSPTTMLVAGDVATTTGDQIMVAHQKDMAMFTDWVQGGLVFEDTPLREVIRDVSRMYGVKISLADTAIAGQLVTASLNDQPLNVVMDGITRVIGARYEQNGRTIVIRRGAPSIEGPDRGHRAPLATADAKVSRSGT